jgi:GNAT superfamily N-acetyltransferase
MDAKPYIIRPFEPRDAAQAAQVWSDGLDQTIDSAPAEKRASFKEFFTKCRDEAFAEGGDVGVEGHGLVEFYYHDPNGKEDRDCRMFVAVSEPDDGSAVASTVLGLVGIKRGMHQKDFPASTADDYGFFSVWKMSVASDGRRMGIGKRLMGAIESWVKTRSRVDAIRLFTGNPVAARFYTSPKVGYTLIEKTDNYGVFEKTV